MTSLQGECSYTSTDNEEDMQSASREEDNEEDVQSAHSQ